MENCENIKTYEELEEDFELFCKEQEKTIPPFKEIWDNSEDCKKLKEFNNFFEQTIQNNKLTDFGSNESLFKNNGYGDLMDESQSNLSYEPTSSKKPSKSLPCKSIINYKDPEYNPIGYGNNIRFDVDKVDDYSTHLKTNKNITLSDYSMAFPEDTEWIEDNKTLQNTMSDTSKKNLESFIQNRKDFDNLMKNYFDNKPNINKSFTLDSKTNNNVLKEAYQDFSNSINHFD